MAGSPSATADPDATERVSRHRRQPGHALLAGACAKPLSIGKWSTGSCEGVPEIVTNPVRDRSHSVHIDTTSSGGRLVYQDVGAANARYTWKASLYWRALCNWR
jgi:hypothetical protein